CCKPTRSPVFRVATISPFSPGSTSFFARAAVVQPHEVFTALIWIFLSPLFWYLKVATAVSEPGGGFNSSSLFSQASCACAPVEMDRKSAPRRALVERFISGTEKANRLDVKPGSPVIKATHDPQKKDA